VSFGGPPGLRPTNGGSDKLGDLVAITYFLPPTLALKLSPTSEAYGEGLSEGAKKLNFTKSNSNSS
jgi:hypothetical protein